MPTVYLNRFDRGMTPDARDSGSYSQLCKHFDNFTNKHKLIPYRDSEDAYASQTTVQLQNFLMYNSNMYALGRQTSFARASILRNSDVSVPSWSSPSNGDDPTNGITNYTLFFEYLGILYGTNSQGLFSYNIGSSTFTTAAQAFTYNTVTQGLVHSKDSVAYFGYTNSTAAYIASKNGSGAWNMAALTIPTVNHKVVSICEYGNYLAIGMAPLQIGGNSFVILWDKDSSVNSLSETLDLGSKVLYAIEEIDGYLIAVSISGNTSSVIKPKLVFQKYGGGSFILFKEILLASGVNSVTFKQKINNRLYFALNASSLGYTTLYDYTGIWSVGRNGETEPFSVVFAQVPDNNTVPQLIKGFLIVDDYFYISYLDAGSGNYGLSKTNDQASYTATAVYRTVKNPNMPEVDKPKKKQLMGVALTYDTLPTDGQVVLKYKVDGNAYTTVFTETNDSVQVSEYVKAGSTEFTSGRDFEFEINSTGGGDITGLVYRYEPLKTNI